MKSNQSSSAHELRSRDIYLSTVFKQAGIPIIRVENTTGKAIFVFRACKEIEELTTKYFNDELRVNPKSLFETWKSLKSMAYSAIGDVR